jgi:hypothetical protein
MFLSIQTLSTRIQNALYMVTLATVVMTAPMASTAHAAKLKVSIEKQTQNNVQVFTIGADGWYTASSNDSHSHTQIRGEGMLSAVNRDKNERDTDVIGKEIPGFDRIKIAKNDRGQTVLIRQYRGEVSVPDHPQPYVMEGSYSVPLEFKTGNYASFQAGETVIVTISPKGSEAVLAQIKSELLRVLGLMKDAFIAQGLEVVDVKVEKMTSKSGLMEVNPETITVTGGSSQISASFKVKL